MIQARQIYIIAKHLWLENIRNRAFMVLTCMGSGLLFGSVLISNMAVGNMIRVFQHYGFWVLGVWGLVLALFFGVNIIKNELMNKTIYLVLSRPVQRWVFLVGKFAGIVALMTLLFAILSLIFILLVKAMAIPTPPIFFVALVFIFFEWILLAAFSVLFAALTSPALHIFFLIGLYIMGHWSKHLYIFSKNTDSPLVSRLLSVLFHIVPNLEAFNFREAAIYGEQVTIAVMGLSSISCMLWAACIMALAIIMFNKKRLM